MLSAHDARLVGGHNVNGSHEAIKVSVCDGVAGAYYGPESNLFE
jgi:hypothetical protein